MVNTRSTYRKKDPMDEPSAKVEPKTHKHSDEQPMNEEKVVQACRDITIKPDDKMASAAASAISAKKSSSSVLAKRKKLQLEAAEAKARIEMELIDKRLAADLAELDGYSSQKSLLNEGKSVNDTRGEVEKWLQRSQQELEDQTLPRQGTQPEGLDQPLPPAARPAAGLNSTDNGTVHMLATALKDLAAVTATNGPNTRMLSRICTPRELPSFSGDPMEWLQFRQAYHDSTDVCNFNDQENLWRLRKCLHGAAKDAVSALFISAASPTDVISTLELQFGNPDVIISKIMYEIKKLQPVCQDYHKDIVKFSVKVKNFVAAVLAIGQDEYLKGTSLISVILSKLPTILISKWADYSYLHISNETKPKLLLLSEFLEEEAVKMTKTSVIVGCYNPSDYYNKRKQSDYNSNRTHHVLMNNTADNNNYKCRFCNSASNHKITECKRFLKALRKDRWQFIKRNGLCFKCLLARHNRESCSAPVCDKDNCGQPHHRLLHNVYTRNDNNNLPDGKSELNNCEINKNEQLESVSQNNTQSETITHIQTNSYKVLLKTVPVCVHGPNGNYDTVALLDDGSTVSIISENLVNRLGIRGCKQTLRVRGAWDNSDLTCSSEVVNLRVSNKNGTMFTLQARSTNGLNLPTQFVSLDELTCSDDLKNIRHLLCDKQCKPELLIGQDNYHLIIPEEIKRDNPDGPYVTRTALGWCLHGRISPSMANSQHSTLLLSGKTVDEEQQEARRLLFDLHEEVRRSFTIEAMGISGKPRQNSESRKALEHLEHTSLLKDGRWYVGLPWKDATCKMSESYNNANNRLKGIIKKYQANPGYAARYSERVDHLLKNNYAHELRKEEVNKVTPHTWYLPHFGVDNPNKNKLRLVFDAAAKSNGFSLNDYLITGPDLLVSLYGIMLRFREYQIAVTGDIRDMFLRIKIIPEDRHALRFLWRSPDSTNNDIKSYTMSSLIFGANCSPFIAQFIKNKNAKQYESTKPEAVNAICKQHYMDDYIDSVEHTDTAIQLIKDISHIHQQGGFEITNWTSNFEEVLNSLPKETLCSSTVRFKIGQQDVGERTLGLLWFHQEDELGFDVSFKRIPKNIIDSLKRPTKREMLRIIMSIFDVYGFLSPFTIKAKILLQQMWKTNLSWDDEIPDSVSEKWFGWLELLKYVNKVRLPRCYHASVRASEIATAAPNELNSKRRADIARYTNLQLHVFCDASTHAMCAVGYWRWINNNEKIQIAFISSKCRVAPVKHTSVPRLELQAAVLAARLADTIIKEHRMVPQEKYYWCDSSTVLHWIRNTARDYKVYVAHRLGEIDELSLRDQWHYIPTKMNVADVATRDTCDVSVLQGEWLFGPEFLYKEKDYWPADLPGEVCTENLERVSLVREVCSPAAVPEPERFSSWLRLLRTTCVVLSFIDKCRKLTGEINGDMMRRAERLLIMHSQSQSFAEDLKHLKNTNTLERTSKLLTLSPYIDDTGILRVGGRIDSAPEIAPETKHPVILDGRNYIAMLIVKHYHIRAAHGCRETVVNNLKQKYWLLRMRPTVKHISAKCMYCRIKKTQPLPPRMGDLPAARMAHHHRPFTFCGLDLFGPMQITIGRRREKRYGVLFTCLTVRAIHIELVSDLTSDALIMSLRRMAARRGWPQHLYSDNGTNLRGADNELKNSVKDLNENALKEEASNYGATWTFSPPASPHWGGAWERLIRSVKQSLKVVLKERAPREEVLITLLTEVEQTINSRPLTHVSVEPGSDESLTPNHFLLGSTSNLPRLGVFNESDTFLRRQWRISQALADLFWKRWIREVLPDMCPRHKWKTETRPLQVGDLVLVVDPASPRNLWPRGRIQNVMPGKDGRVRVVDIKTKSGLLRRSATRVAVIPTGDVC